MAYDPKYCQQFVSPIHLYTESSLRYDLGEIPLYPEYKTCTRCGYPSITANGEIIFRSHHCPRCGVKIIWHDTL